MVNCIFLTTVHPLRSSVHGARAAALAHPDPHGREAVRLQLLRQQVQVARRQKNALLLFMLLLFMLLLFYVVVFYVVVLLYWCCWGPKHHFCRQLHSVILKLRNHAKQQHYRELHNITVSFTTLNNITVNFTTLPWTSQHYRELHNITVNFTTLILLLWTA
jgi:hypothetical protein